MTANRKQVTLSTSPRPRFLSGILACAVFALVSAATAPAWAVTTCSLSSGTLTIGIAAGSGVRVVRSGQAIEVRDPALVSCGGPTVTNTDLIVVNEASAGDNSLDIDLGGGKFAPGMTSEGGTSSEIEWIVNIGPGGSDLLGVAGSSGADFVIFGNGTGGSPQINLNAQESPDDADVTFNVGVDAPFGVRGFGGADTISGAGGQGTGPVFSKMLWINGDGGIDTLTGGSAGDEISAGGGSYNLMRGGFGADSIQGGPGDDAIYGGPGADFISGLGGWDAIYGGPGNDTAYAGSGEDYLFGNAGADFLHGGSGHDSISGGGGVDKLLGASGPDFLDAEDNTQDKVNGGPNPVGIDDICSVDPSGDVVVACEEIN